MLTALFTSRARIELLSVLFLHQDKDFYVRELERATGEDYKNISLELRSLEGIGLLSSRKEGNLKYYSLNKEFILYDELKSIFMKSRGIYSILKDALAGKKDIEFAFVYGSFASGEETFMSDIDLMVIGKIPLEKLLKLLREPEHALGREINASLYEYSEMRKRLRKGDAFITQVINGPLVMLRGDEGEIRKTAQKRASLNFHAN